jgi:uroporphyrinogen-III synthase
VPAASRARLRAALKNPKRRPQVITFTSSSTVKNFVELLGVAGRSHNGQRPSALKEVALASIGPVTSTTLRDLKLGVDIEAREYTIHGLIQAIVANKQGQKRRY